MISRFALVFLFAIAILFVATATTSSFEKNLVSAIDNHKFLPVAFDWAENGFNLPIWGENSQCGGLPIAASIADAISGADFVSNKLPRPTLCSAAQLVDCDVLYRCNGGYDDRTVLSLISNSSGLLATNQDYPWSANNQQGNAGKCRSDLSEWKACSSKVVGVEILPNNEQLMKQWLFQNGPFTIVTSDHLLCGYTAGDIVSGSKCAFDYYAQMFLVTGWGLGEVNGKTVEKWIARASFGTSFGNNGTIWLQMGVNCSGIAGFARGVKVAPRS